MLQSQHHQTPVCKRCGTCCRKGGPALHLEDKPLLDQGHIPIKHLFTLRAGQPALDNVRGGLMPLTGDVIKIKGQAGSETCLYFDHAGGRCTIYEHRPVECRVLQCWNTGPIEKLYERDRLARKDLLETANELLELVQDHQKRCDYALIGRLLKGLKTGDKKRALEALSQMLHYDRHLRMLVAEQASPENDITDFLFGRPLAITLNAFGMRLTESKGRYKLVGTFEAP